MLSAGKLAGDILSGLGGTYIAEGGVGLTIVGVSTSEVGVGVPAAAVGIAATAYGAKVTSKATVNTIKDAKLFAESLNGGGSKQPKNIEKVKDSYLKKLGIDAHEVKKDVLGKKAKIAEYDIYKDKDTGELWVNKKDAKGEWIPTGETIK